MATLGLWGFVCILASGLIWLILREARRGAVNKFLAEEQESIEKVRTELAKLRAETARAGAAAQRKRLLGEYTRH